MARSFILAVLLVIGQLLFASHSQAVSSSFTLKNYLAVEDFFCLYCHCVDVGGNVTAFGGTVSNCVDKEFQTTSCPNGVSPLTVFCNFKYYQRNREVYPATITGKYANVQVWASTGPAKTYYQLAPDAIYGTVEDRFFDVSTANKSAEWNLLYEGNHISILRDNTLGNGWSFK